LISFGIVRVSIDDSNIVFRETDFENTGPSIPDEIITKIMEPLFTTKQKGTGLGLTSCNNIIKLHNGKITVSNNPTTFSVIFPNNQEQFKNQILQREMKYIVTQRNFKNCILTHKLTHEIDSLGYPTACKESIRMFKMCGGTNKIDKTKVMFNKIKEEQI